MISFLYHKGDFLINITCFFVKREHLKLTQNKKFVIIIVPFMAERSWSC